MEPSGRNRRNRRQMGCPPKRLRQAKTVAVGCDQLPESFHGKDGVAGSIPAGGSMCSLRRWATARTHDRGFGLVVFGLGLWALRWAGSPWWGRGPARGAVPGGGVDHADVQVLDEQDDVGSGMGSADAEVVQPAGDAQGDAAAVVDAVVPDPVVGVGVAAGGGLGLGEGGVDGLATGHPGDLPAGAAAPWRLAALHRCRWLALPGLHHRPARPEHHAAGAAPPPARPGGGSQPRCQGHRRPQPAIRPVAAQRRLAPAGAARPGPVGWAQALLLDGELAVVEPKTLRYRLWHAAPADRRAVDRQVSEGDDVRTKP
jgi:hypothetical protein